MDIFGMMAELAADGVCCRLLSWQHKDGRIEWQAVIGGWEPMDKFIDGVVATPEEAWRKACDARDKTPEKERYRQTPQKAEPTVGRLLEIAEGFKHLECDVIFPGYGRVAGTTLPPT